MTHGPPARRQTALAALAATALLAGDSATGDVLAPAAENRIRR